MFHTARPLLVLLLAATAAAPAAAQTTWHVDDDGPGDPGPLNPLLSDPAEDGSAAHPFDRVQEGIAAAAGGDVVLVQAGLYFELGTVNLQGKAIHLLGAAGAAETVIDMGNFLQHVMQCTSGEGAGTIVEGFAIKFGTGRLIGTLRYGGGIYMTNSSSPTIRGDTAVGFNTADLGAGMFIDKNCNPLLQDILVANNITANKGVGAGLHVLGNPTFDNCRIAENTATNGGGGGIYFGNSSSSITGSTIVENWAYYGGGIQVNGGSPTISGNVFNINSVVTAPVNGEGGGIGIVGKSKALVTNNTFKFNKAHGGAGIYTYDASPTIVTNLIHDNTAATNSNGGFGFGGGVSMGKTGGSLELNEIFYNIATLGGGISTRAGTTALLYGNLVDHNDAASSGPGVGGGLYSKDSSPTVLANTLGYNAASKGGGLYVIGKSAPSVDTSIIWGNAASSDPSFFDGSGLLLITFSDVEGTSIGGSSLSVDPLFVDPASRNFRLGAGSPVVDAGNFAFGGGGNDVYGSTRVNNGRIDMGAAEQ